MKVYLVRENRQHEGGTLLGVYTDPRRAIDAARGHAVDLISPYGSGTVTVGEAETDVELDDAVVYKLYRVDDGMVSVLVGGPTDAQGRISLSQRTVIHRDDHAS